MKVTLTLSLTKLKRETVKQLKGIYVLIIRVSKNIKVNIGALGRKVFAKGLYAYAGSAQINLEQRVKRHLRHEKQLFWHIDYLLGSDAAEIVKVFYKQGDKTEECKTARFIGENGTPIACFGCSDCNCKSHFFRISDYAFLLDSMQTLNMLS